MTSQKWNSGIKKWQEKHGRLYKSRGEWERRFEIYLSNVEFINYINSQNLSFKLTDNKFADMTNEQFKSLFMDRLTGLHHTRSNNSSIRSNKTLPKYVDWRKKGAVTRVKDQRECGSSFTPSPATIFKVDLPFINDIK